MIEVNYCLEAMDFADMAALRRRLTRIIPILFFAAVGFGCAVAGFSARSHQPIVALAACMPLLVMGVLLLCRGPVSRRKAGSVRNSRCVPYGHVRRRI